MDSDILSWSNLVDVQSVLSSILVSVLALWLLVRKPLGIPPGPRWRTPILGNLREFTSHFGLRSTLQGLHHTFGDVYSLFLCRRLVVIVSGKKSIDRMLKKDEKALERVNIFDDIFEPIKGRSKKSKSHNLMFRSLQKIFEDPNIIEEKIHQTSDQLTEALVKCTNTAVDPIDTISRVTSELVYAILFDKNTIEDNPVIDRLASLNKELSKLRGDDIMMRLVPTLRYLPSERARCQKLEKLREQIRQIFLHEIEEAKVDWEWREDDVISTYYRLVEKEGAECKLEDSEVCDILVSVYMSLTRTITTMLYNAILFLTKHQHIQEQICDETTHLIGRNKKPSGDDSKKLGFTKSFVWETKRFVKMNSVLGYARQTTDETRLLGYAIPKKTLILADVESLMTDPSIWDDPLEFQPTRFTTDEEMVAIVSKKAQYLKGDTADWADSFTDTTTVMMISILVKTFTVKQATDEPTDQMRKQARYSACFEPRP